MSRAYGAEPSAGALHRLTPPDGANVPVRSPSAPAPGTPLTSHYGRCFGCGADHPTGLHLNVEAGPDVNVHAVLEVGEHHQGAPGLAHGGLLAAAIDEAMGHVNWLIGAPAVTGRLETTFLRPVPVGTRLHLDARAVAVAGRRVFMAADGRLGAADGPVADAVFVQVPLEHFSTYGRPQDVAQAAADARASGTRRFEVNP
jgi:acyl-coenzyme A thioesterase PaaI-like protein